MKLLYTLLLTFSLTAVFGQAKTATDLVTWSATHDLTVNDFGIKLKKGRSGQAEFQLATETRTNLYTHQKRVLVRNTMVRSRSSINPKEHLTEQLRFQQTLFDIMEIYARQLRKTTQVGAAPAASAKKTPGPEERIVAAAAKRRQRYGVETQYGTLATKQAQWEKTIRQELAALQSFAVPE